MFYISDHFGMGLLANDTRSSMKISIIKINDPKTIAPLIQKTTKLNSFKSLVKTKKNAAILSKALGITVEARPKEELDKISFTLLDQFYCGEIDSETGEIVWFTISRLS